jgi:hypothetical protein
VARSCASVSGPLAVTVPDTGTGVARSCASVTGPVTGIESTCLTYNSPLPVELTAVTSPSSEVSVARVSRRRAITCVPTGSATLAASSVYCVPPPTETGSPLLSTSCVASGLAFRRSKTVALIAAEAPSTIAPSPPPPPPPPTVFRLPEASSSSDLRLPEGSLPPTGYISPGQTLLSTATCYPAKRDFRLARAFSILAFSTFASSRSPVSSTISFSSAAFWS